MHPALTFVLGFMACLVTLVPLTIFWFLFRPWLRSFLGGSGASVFHLLGARLRGSPVNLLLDAQLALIQRGKRVSFQDVERIYIAHKHRILGAGDLIDFVEQGLTSQAKPA